MQENEKDLGRENANLDLLDSELDLSCSTKLESSPARSTKSYVAYIECVSQFMFRSRFNFV